MYIKQWAAALLLGAIVLGTASCAKDEPKKPETSIAIEDLAGTWNLSGATFSPETVTVGGTEYKVADHIFKAFIFGGLSVAPSKVKIEGEKATLISVVEGVEKTFDVTVKVVSSPSIPSPSVMSCAKATSSSWRSPSLITS